jgi:transketolase
MSQTGKYKANPPAPGMAYMSKDLKAGLDLRESTVTDAFDERSWDMVVSLGLSRQLSTGKTLLELAAAGHDDIVVCTADLGRPTQVIGFGETYPDRYFNFGIAERNMIGAAAGLATMGLTPVISNYSFFLALMGVENIRNDICYTNLPVKMIGTHSGIAMGFYGTSHHCCEDIGALRAIANLTLMAPCDGVAIASAFKTNIRHPGPIYFRAGRGREAAIYEKPFEFRIGGSNTLREGKHATVLAIGNLVKAALDAHDLLAPEGISITVVDMYSIRPIDRAAIRKAAAEHGVIISAEEHNVTGGFGAAVAEVMAEEGLPARLTRVGMPDDYSILGPPTHLYRHYGLDGEGVAKAVRAALGAKASQKAAAVAPPAPVVVAVKAATPKAEAPKAEAPTSAKGKPAPTKAVASKAAQNKPEASKPEPSKPAKAGKDQEKKGKDSKAKDKTAKDRKAKAAKAAKPARVAKPAKAAKATRPGKSAKPGKAEKPGKAAKVGKAAAKAPAKSAAKSKAPKRR